MTQLQKALIVLAVATLGIWGCAQGPAGSASAEKIKVLEAKMNRLEEDFRAAAAARDQFRKKLTETEQASALLKQDLDTVTKERDDTAALLKARTAERDLASTQFDAFRKNLKELLGQTEAALAKPAKPNVTTVSKPKGSSL